MGTHPIFESDFDCLTECYPNSQATSDVSLFASWPPLLHWPIRRVRPKSRHFWKSVLQVPPPLVTYKRLAKYWLLVTVLLVSMVSEISKPRRWLSSHPELRVWL